MKTVLYGCLTVLLLTACGESEKVEIYNENNTVVKNGIVYDINEKPINGIYKVYYPNGNVKMEVKSRNGQPDGEGRFYAEEGWLLFQGTFKNGLIEGKMLNFYEDGSVHNELNYKDGVQDGISKTYDENGELSIEAEYQNGKAVNGVFYLLDSKIDLSADDLQKLSAQEPLSRP